MNSPTKSQILAQIAQIQLMERGKLSTYTFADRSGHAGPYYKLQCWEEGKNRTRYVPAEQVPLLQEALAGQAKFQQLTEQYAQLVIAETRAQLAAGSKKKTSRPKSSWLRIRKSNN